MGAETPNQVATAAQAVFLSYASQDANAARRICDALRAEGIEVWFDQSELRGGDVWDQKIRREIRDCALFIPAISTNTASRREGYFRLEWDLADQRSHRMARDQAFIVPVCLDATPGSGTDVPESFHRVQWTRLPNGETPSEFVARIKRLLSSESPITARLPSGPVSGAPPIPRTTSRSAPLRRGLFVAVALLVLAALAYLLINKPWISKPAAVPATSSATSSSGAPSAAFNPPPHSIAVLPFVNMSGDKEQEYFSDGLSEELLNDLSRINELQVAARTSAFSFKGKDIDIGTIARKLNVGAVLEGSVRRTPHTVRVTAQLINAVSGFHIWSQTYDRDLNDILKLQTDIADAVANALKVTLLGDVAAKIEVGSTRNPAAFDAYLRGWKRFYDRVNGGTSHAEGLQASSVLFSQAVRLDPNYALAYMARSWSFSEYGRAFATTSSMRDDFLQKALADARKSIELAPDLGEGYGALAAVFEDQLEFESARKAYDSSRTLSPGIARVWRNYSEFYAAMGFADEAVTAARRGVTLDPLNALSHCRLGGTLFTVHRYDEALAAFNECEALISNATDVAVSRGLVHYEMGDYAAALASCEAGGSASADAQGCLALVYHKVGKASEAEAQLEKLKAAEGEAGAYDYAGIYAQWGDRTAALMWLETAWRLRDPELRGLKTEPLLDPLRNEPRFQAIERELKFPK
jgi:TolB-like protein/tetratricopeptide (TPR) repeat protein